MTRARIIAVAIASLASILVSTPADSQELYGTDEDRPFSISPNLSTLGVGLEVGYRVNPYFGLRLGGNYFAFDDGRELDGIDYDGKLDLRSAGLTADLHPFASGFRISAGTRLNFNEASLSATPTSNEQIGDGTYTPAQIGSITGEIDFNRFSPYVGIGYEGAPLATRAFTLAFEAGVMYHGAPKVSLSATGAAADPALADDMERERRNVEDDLQEYKLYPVIALTAKYRF